MRPGWKGLILITVFLSLAGDLWSPDPISLRIGLCGSALSFQGSRVPSGISSKDRDSAGLVSDGEEKRKSPPAVVRAQEFSLFPGGVVFIPAKPAEREARFLGYTFFPVWYKGTRGFLLAAPLTTSPGEYQVVVKGKTQRIIKMAVRPKTYPTEHLKLPKKMVRFPPDILARIRKEVSLLRRHLSSVEGSCQWEAPFILPAEGRLSSPFGLKRILNGEPRSPHGGIDLALPPGTPVKAAQDGRVELVGNFYLPGKAIVLSHGCGVHTYYAHLSEILVKEGEWVRRGQVIALSGASGRATGPHLHFGFYVSGIKVDPLYTIRILKGIHGSGFGG